MKKKQIFVRFFCFLRPALGHGRLGHPQSLEYSLQFLLSKWLITTVNSFISKLLVLISFQPKNLFRRKLRSEQEYSCLDLCKHTSSSSHLPAAKLTMPPRERNFEIQEGLFQLGKRLFLVDFTTLNIL